MPELKAPYFEVRYVDDFKRKHLTIARDLAEVLFLKERFEEITFDLIDF